MSTSRRSDRARIGILVAIVGMTFIAGLALGSFLEQTTAIKYMRAAHVRAEQAEQKLEKYTNEHVWSFITSESATRLKKNPAVLLEVVDDIAQTVKSKRAAIGGESGYTVIPIGSHDIIFYALTKDKDKAMGFARTSDNQLIPFLWQTGLTGQDLPAKPTKLCIQHGRRVSLQEL